MDTLQRIIRKHRPLRGGIVLQPDSRNDRIIVWRDGKQVGMIERREIEENAGKIGHLIGRMLHAEST